MILVASQRGGAKQLGLHLLKTEENEHVEIHEVRGFVSDDVVGALKETQAVAAGTRCKQFLFSVSLNPPQNESVNVAAFESALGRIEERCGLSGQPRIVVFHEKEGRRHCHAVWSRIDADAMTARPLPFFKNKLQDVARELYREHGWRMPQGFMQSRAADPRNFSLAEWQQAKRMNLHGRDLKEMVQECWAVSDNRQSFVSVLQERGLKLARGDRRGFVAVSVEGEALSISRYVGKKAKEVEAKLGAPADLPGVEETKAQIARELTPVVRTYLNDADQEAQRRMAPVLARKSHMAQRHRDGRACLDDRQRERATTAAQARADRLRKGLFGLWDRITGRRAQIERQNAAEADQAKARDRTERQNLIDRQLTERRLLQAEIVRHRARHVRDKLEVHRELARLRALGQEPTPKEQR